MGYFGLRKIEIRKQSATQSSWHRIKSPSLNLQYLSHILYSSGHPTSHSQKRLAMFSPQKGWQFWAILPQQWAASLPDRSPWPGEFDFKPIIKTICQNQSTNITSTIVSKWAFEDVHLEWITFFLSKGFLAGRDLLPANRGGHDLGSTTGLTI